MAGDPGAPPEEAVQLVGQPVWDGSGPGETLSSLEGGLGGNSAVWLLTDPVWEDELWQRLTDRCSGDSLYTWSAGFPAAGGPESVAGSEDDGLLLARSGHRAGLAKFAGKPVVHSVFRRIPLPAVSAPELVRPFLRRSSGFALAFGPGDHAEAWPLAAQLMEDHFSLSLDVVNSASLEAVRRRLTALYVELAVDLGLTPVIPLNRHPYAGVVLFTRPGSYDALTERLAPLGTFVQGTEGSALLERMTGRGGDMAYT
ncbi:hypothetical protein AB0M28_25225 [Streptomyces sp. NPDC051940]|uniref:hypothetical protein n=1 Tax=Streptomyces sp. NPDC051940 TaxID=3155675 RepID=UPI003423BDA0